MELLGLDIPTAGDVLALGAAPDGTLSPDQTLPVIRDAVNAAWRDDVQPRLTEVLRRELGKADRFADGFTLYDIDVRLSGADPVQTVQRTAGGDVLIHVQTGRSTIVATSTQPSFLGSYADPRFSIDFSVTFDVLLDIPPVTGPIGGSKVLNLRLVAPHLDSQNFPGDVLLLVAKAIVGYITGGDIDTLIAQAANQALGADQVNGALQPLNDAMQRLLSSGHRYLSLLAGDPDDLMRQLGARAAQVEPIIRALPAESQSLLLLCQQPDESGVIEGEISWPESAGGPIDRRLFGMISTVATGLLPDTALAHVRATVERDEPGELLAAAGDELEAVRLQAASAGFAAAPMATQVQEASLAGSPGVRLWDASTEAEPAGVADLGFAGVALEEARLSLRAFEPEDYESIMDVFRRGPKQFVVHVVVSEPGGGTHETGRMVAMWHDSSDGWERRRYRMESVETGTPLTVTAELDAKWRWTPRAIASIDPRNWSGTVTVNKAREFGQVLRDGDVQVSVATADGSRRTVTLSVLEGIGALPRDPNEQRSLVIQAGTPGDEVALNPQPLPPKWLERLAADRGDDRAIIIVGGRPGDEVSLNPQPLPPRWREEVAELVQQRDAGGVGGAGVQLRNRAGGEEVGAAWVRSAGGGRAVRLWGVPRGGGSFLVRAGAGPVLLGRARRTREGGGVEQQRREGAVMDDTISQAASAIVASVDEFGDLVTAIDPDILIPDTVNPTGHGSVRGVDFRVWPD